jgi:tetratricopeptide (TPR) repeat protein
MRTKPNKKKLIPTLIFLTAISIPLYSESPEVFDKRGVQLGQQKSYKKAIEEFDKALKIYDSSSAKSLHNRAWVLELKGDTAEAIKNYEEAIRRNPSQLPSYKRLGYLYYKVGEYEKAVDIGEHILKEEPGNSQVLKWLPEAYKMKLEKDQQRLIEEKRERFKKKSDETLSAEKGMVEGVKQPKAKPPALAQDIFLKIGYIPAHRTTFNKYKGLAVNDIELNGFALQAESNIYIHGIWFGIGIEWQRLERKNTDGYYLYNYLMPSLSMKYLTSTGLFFGVGFSGKYLFAVTNPDNAPLKDKKDTDLWANAIVGFCLPLDGNIILCLENRIGWNVTQRQFSEFRDSSVEYNIRSSYDFAFYIGIGLRIKYSEKLSGNES